jgi:UDP-3-O-acyl N-acetylglucosamine deacetylase
VTRQRTIKDSVSIKGVGLQTGEKVTLDFRSAPAGSGISFIRTDLPDKPVLNINSIDFNPSRAPERRTTLVMGPLQIQTTEHLLAALSGLGIDNIVIETDNVELPGLDGSAKGFLDLLASAKIVEQDAPREVLEIKEVVWCGREDSMIAVFPSDNFKVSYTLSYKNPAIGTQFLSIDIDKKSFETQIAPARTFCLEEEAMELLKRGLGKGANYDNTLVIGKSGPVKNTPRFADEPVRHKVLDLIGDLCLLCAQVKGHVVAIKSGHRLNMELVAKLKSKI